jgi:RNA polymerase sigma-70 factor (ECF subfamily)
MPRTSPGGVRRVFRSLPSYTPGTFEGWLHRITTNLFLDMARRKQRIRFEGLGEDAAGRLSGDELTPAQAFDARHLDGDVQDALAALAPEYRAAVVLCDIEGLSYEEVAVTLGVKLGTVRSRIHRGRAQLRVALEHRRPRTAARPAASAPAAAAASAAIGATGGWREPPGAPHVGADRRRTHPRTAGAGAGAPGPVSAVPARRRRALQALKQRMHALGEATKRHR